MWKIPHSPPPKQGINVTSTTQNYASSKQQLFQAHLSSSGYSDILPRENTLRVSDSILKQEQNNERFICPCVHFSKPPQTHSPSMKGRKKSNEIVISTDVDDQRMSPFDVFCFLILFDSSFSTIISFFSSVHLSFMEMAK